MIWPDKSNNAQLRRVGVERPGTQTGSLAVGPPGGDTAGRRSALSKKAGQPRVWGPGGGHPGAGGLGEAALGGGRLRRRLKMTTRTMAAAARTATDTAVTQPAMLACPAALALSRPCGRGPYSAASWA